MFHPITLLEAAKAKWPATHPTTPRVSRPKRFPIHYFHVTNNNSGAPAREARQRSTVGKKIW